MEPLLKADIQGAMLADTPLEEVDPGTSSETVETSADANKALGKSEDEKVQVESPIEDLITREISVEEESSKETTLEEESPVDTISTEETVERKNIIHEKSPVIFDSKNELDTEPLSKNNSPEESHTKVDKLVEKEKVEQKSIPDEKERQETPLKDAEASETSVSENMPTIGSTMESLLTEDIAVVSPAETYEREALPEEPSVEISVATQSMTADTEALYEEPANVSIKPCVEVTSEALPDDDDVYLTPVDVLDKVGTSKESGIYLAPLEMGADESTSEDEECLYEEIDDYLVKPTNCKYFTPVLLTKNNYKTWSSLSCHWNFNWDSSI